MVPYTGFRVTLCFALADEVEAEMVRAASVWNLEERSMTPQ